MLLTHPVISENKSFCIKAHIQKSYCKGKTYRFYLPIYGIIQFLPTTFFSPVILFITHINTSILVSKCVYEGFLLHQAILC